MFYFNCYRENVPVSVFTEKRRVDFLEPIAKREKLEYDKEWKGTIHKTGVFSIAVRGEVIRGAFRSDWIGTDLTIDGMIDRQELFIYVESLKNWTLFKQVGFMALFSEDSNNSYDWFFERLKTNDKAVLLHNEKIDTPVHNDFYVALVPIVGDVPQCLKESKLPSEEFLLMVIVSSATV